MDRRAALSGLFLLALAACGREAEPESAAPFPAPLPEVPWIVSAAHPLAVDAGAEILAKGGSAVDAAIAVEAVLGLVEPQSSGLGGGAFMLFYDASSGETIAYDGRETAPASTIPTVFYREDGTPMGFYEAVTSGFATGVPGLVAMMDLAHRQHGKLEWAELFAPAERLAREGFPMPQRLHDTLGRFPQFREDPETEIYLLEDGSVKPIGTTVTNPLYAETIREIAEGGAAAFYTGSIADAIIERVNGKTGVETLTKDDFLSYVPEIREPVCAVVYAHNTCSMPPPGSGGITLIQIATIFEEVAGRAAPEDALLAYIEASRLAYADRGRFIGDPTAMGTDMLSADDLVLALTSRTYLSERARLVGDKPAEEVAPGNPDGYLLREGRIDDTAYEVPSTTHFSIRDSEGNIVSMTATVEFPFGSQMMVRGMVLNNQLTDFSRIPEVDGVPAVNAPGPGKRPMSSMTPLIVFDADGEPYAALGSPGGTAIIGYVAKPLLRHLATGEPLSEAIKRPHVVVPRGSVIVEEGGDALAKAAEELGYSVTQRPLSSGIYGFALTNGGIDLVVDPRREGSAKTSVD
ncbi:gamma-glutamyltransferase family protein [Parvularcula lutaonensis]|uniref:Gamma-glutamyltransferase family protein n=1 Tax=Parvularcula lutaonensis TaxID=491923 RepID=A0ABV7M9S7_9PROT|nr:gamma-glutamyltransferase family protein [Parvularcula lutaonensis]GGY44181.1 gamma-glutamyltranspeptidase [Parvularcula lutaonensis]